MYQLLQTWFDIDFEKMRRFVRIKARPSSRIVHKQNHANSCWQQTSMNDIFQSIGHRHWRSWFHIVLRSTFHLTLSHIQKDALQFSKANSNSNVSTSVVRVITSWSLRPKASQAFGSTKLSMNWGTSKHIYIYNYSINLVSQNRKNRSPPCWHFGTPHDRWSGSAWSLSGDCNLDSDKNDENNDDKVMKMNIWTLWTLFP